MRTMQALLDRAQAIRGHIKAQQRDPRHGVMFMTPGESYCARDLQVAIGPTKYSAWNEAKGTFCELRVIILRPVDRLPFHSS